MSDKKKQNNQKKDWKPLIIYIIMQLAGIFGGAVAAIIVFSITSAASGEEGFSDSGMTLAVGTGVSVATMAIVFVTFLVMYRKRLKDDFKRLTKKQWGLLILTAILVIMANAGLSILMESAGVEMSNQESLAESMSALLIPTAIATAILAPMVEELVFRYSLGSIIKNPIVFVIVSSLIFAVLHATNIAIVIYLILGVAFSLAYIKTDRNVVASIFLHFVNNLIGTIGLVMLALGIE